MAIYITWDGGSWAFDLTLNERHESKLNITEHPVEQGPDITDNARRELDRISCEVLVTNAPLIDLNNYGGKRRKINLDDPNYRNGQPAKYSPPFAPTPGAVFSALGPVGQIATAGIASPKAGIGAATFAVISALGGGSDAIPSADVLAWDSPFDAIADSNATLTWLQDYAKLVTVYTTAATYENMLLEVKQLNREPMDGDAARYRLTFKQIRTVSLAFTDAPTPKDPRGEAPVDKGSKGTKDAPPAKKSILKFGLPKVGAAIAGLF